jgi:hypothetical protein
LMVDGSYGRKEKKRKVNSLPKRRLFINFTPFGFRS